MTDPESTQVITTVWLDAEAHAVAGVASDAAPKLITDSSERRVICAHQVTGRATRIVQYSSARRSGICRAAPMTFLAQACEVRTHDALRCAQRQPNAFTRLRYAAAVADDGTRRELAESSAPESFSFAAYLRAQQ